MPPFTETDHVKSPGRLLRLALYVNGAISTTPSDGDDRAFSCATAALFRPQRKRAGRGGLVQLLRPLYY